MTEQEFYKEIGRLNKLSAETDIDNKAEKRKLKIEYSHFIKQVEKELHDDRHNFLSWLLRKPCSYKHPVTKNVIDVYIGDDAEAVFYFLRFCYLLNTEKTVDDDFVVYLTYLITRSNTQEEC